LEIKQFKNHEETSKAIAEAIIETLQKKPNACIVVTSGDTPTRAYGLLVSMAPANLFDKATLISLDEWVGIARNHTGGCSYMVNHSLFKPLNLAAERYHFFDATASDLQAECQRIDDVIFEKGGLDFVLVGLGLNGHIGLNEPGTPFNSYCTVTQLDPMTAEVGQKYFSENTILSQGITVGLKHMLEAKKVIIMATGEKKKSIVNQVAQSKPLESLPATFIHSHSNGYIYTDVGIES
jgi:6-phosphogluconolactonase/glucosamine-6-phosphate isomerase/deaminase